VHISPVSITAISSISPLGCTPQEVWDNYLQPIHHITTKDYQGIPTVQSLLNPKSKAEIAKLRNSNSQYKDLDESVLFALYTARKALKRAQWEAPHEFGINIGSSRGATGLFEKYHTKFIETGKAATLSSPTTTLGNISSWVANDLQTNGPNISHSITCSTALHAVLNGVVWLQSGLTDQFMVGGSEAPLTPFTIAQMKALKIYAQDSSLAYPCRALDPQKKRNTMFLGEGAAMACLEKGVQKDALALITGIGYATEPLKHNISISTDADCFQKSMRMALGDQCPELVDAIVMHAPGTIKGDQSEYNAIQKIFGTEHPALTTNKWKIGHTFGASGLLSMELAVLMLQHQHFISVPYVDAVYSQEHTMTKSLRKILINAVGFGGNAVSILLELPE